MSANRHQFSLGTLLLWTAGFALWLSLAAWSGPNWPFVVAATFWIVAPGVLRRFHVSRVGAVLIVLALMALLFALLGGAIR